MNKKHGPKKGFKQSPDSVRKRIEARRKNNASWFPPSFSAWNEGLTKYTSEKVKAYGLKRVKGRKTHKAGYILVYAPDSPGCDRHGYMFEHRLVMQEYLNRPLYKHEEVHHVNGIKDDNRMENLQLMTKSEHTRLHMTGNKLSKETMDKRRATNISRYGVANANGGSEQAKKAYETRKINGLLPSKDSNGRFIKT